MLGGAVACAGLAQLSEPEREGLRSVLSVGGLTEQDLNFPRNVHPQVPRLPLIDLAVGQPLEAADRLMRLHASAENSGMAPLLRSALLDALSDQAPSAVEEPDRLQGLAMLPVGIREPILQLASWTLWATSEVREATRELSAEERRVLVESLPRWAVEEEAVRFDFATNRPATRDRTFELVQKVDLVRIRHAAVVLADAVERAIPKLQAAPEDIQGILRVRLAGVVVVVGGRGRDVHSDTDAHLTVDLGGDDLYVGRHGAGVGYASVLVDLGGNDTYQTRDLSIGAGLLGIGIARDLGGSDVARAGSLSLGAGLAGVGVFAKDGGNDSWSATSLSQGFGMFGAGVFLDTGGDDAYSLMLMGQGAGRTFGVGWLVDRSGHDFYRAGGLSLHTPMFADVHFSFAQGFGMGYREDDGGVSGGIGLLTDLAGNDAYIGETYCQAASYWLALGSLYDGGGHDAYTAYHYAQSSAMHLCASFLFDLGGDDGYLIRFGAAHAIGHDYGVAFLLDRAGNDVYAGRDSTPGVGNANGLGVFIDSDGADRYQGPPGRGNPARGTGSLGVFVDLNGADLYREGLADGGAFADGNWGLRLDLPTHIAPPEAEPPPRVSPTPGSTPMPDQTRLEQIFARASQWSVGVARDQVQENLDLLVSIGVPALEWMLENKLATSDRLQDRAFVHVVRALGEPGAAAVGRKVFAEPSTQELKSLIRIAMDADLRDVGAVLPAHIENPEMQMLVVRAAGALQAAACIPELNRLLLSEDPMLARAAMVSLLQIGSAESVTTAQAMLGSPDFLIRNAAIALIAKFPDQARSVGERMSRDPEESKARVGLRLLGSAPSEEALRIIGSFLLDQRPGVRIEALLQLNGRCPMEFRNTFNSLRRDPVALVRTVASQVRVGP